MAIWGVTCLLPQVGHVLVAAARSAAVSTTSKLFLQLSHMNPYLGMGFLQPQHPRALGLGRRGEGEQAAEHGEQDAGPAGGHEWVSFRRAGRLMR